MKSASAGLIPDPEYALKIADLNADEVVDGADLEAFVEGFVQENPIADVNRDEVIDQADADLFLYAYWYEE